MHIYGEMIDEGKVVEVTNHHVKVEFIADQPRTVKFDIKSGKSIGDPNNVWTLLGKKQS
jgi:hypothetical protein